MSELKTSITIEKHTKQNVVFDMQTHIHIETNKVWSLIVSFSMWFFSKHACVVSPKYLTILSFYAVCRDVWIRFAQFTDLSLQR